MIYIKPRQTPCSELDFLNKFISSDFFDKINKNTNQEITLLQEPFSGFGYPDLVCVIWDKSVFSGWKQERQVLETDDIKILHHLYNTKIYKDTTDIKKELGFSLRAATASFERLINASLLKENKLNAVKIKPINEIFFVKDIITIEAKLLNWRKALEQSINNTYFSSKSFTLFPKNIISNRILEEYKTTNVGIISFDKKYQILKKPKKQNIPSTLNSWFFNEYIGRTICN